MAELIVAVAIVTDKYITFDSDDTLANWAGQVLRAKWADAKVPKVERIEVTTHFKGTEDEIRGQLELSLQNVIRDAHLNWYFYKKDMFSANNPAMNVWVMVAIDTSAGLISFEYPEILPVLPLCGPVALLPTVARMLTIGQSSWIELAEDVFRGDKFVGLVTPLDPTLTWPGPHDLFRFGTAAIIHRLMRSPNGTVRLVVQGISRFHISEFVQEKPYLKAKVERAPELVEAGLEIESLACKVHDQFQLLGKINPQSSEEGTPSIERMEDPLQTAYVIANFQRMGFKDRQEILELNSTKEKLQKLAGLLEHEIEHLQSK